MSEQKTTQQKKRALGITTAAGEDKLLLVSMQGTEALGRMFQFELDLISEGKDKEKDPVDYKKVLGHSVDIRLDLLDGKDRIFNGFVSWFAVTGVEENRKDNKLLYHYQATVVPSLWFLTRN